MGTIGNTNPTKQKPQPTTFRFKNIGPVKDAELELGDLTVIAGRNNTGKTYIAYILYAFMKLYEEWPELMDELNFDLVHDADFDSGAPHFIREVLAEKMREIVRAEHKVNQEMRQEMRVELMREMTQAFSGSRLPDVFSSPRSEFQGAEFGVKLGADLSGDERRYETTLPDGAVLSLTYDGEDAVLYMKKGKQVHRHSEINQALSTLYLQFLFPEFPSKTFILSAERFGISLFYRELDFTKNQWVDFLQKMGGDRTLGRSPQLMFFGGATSRYALPIKDNIDYTRSIPVLRAQESELQTHRFFDEIKDMMGGYYGTSGDDIRFISKARGKGRSFNIPLHISSSSARGLSDLYFFLRHVATRNHLIVIDEPESHLDTANQIHLARLLARFVHAGLKVLITTHSDYLIKEINNLVMLNSRFSEKESVLRKLKYQSDDALDPESIRAYVAEDNGLTRCDVDEFGIDMPVFDRTIDEINKVANELASRLSEGEEG